MTKATTTLKNKRIWDPGWSWKVWGVVALLLVPTFGFALWVLAEAGGQTKIDPATLALALRNADGPVTAITGTEHTVYHANDALPEAKAPREDGRQTLVWFTTTTCRKCEEQVFVHAAASQLGRDFVFVEKDLRREPAAARLGVTETPTFVWLDEEGTERGRFTEVADAAALDAQIARILAAP